MLGPMSMPQCNCLCLSAIRLDFLCFLFTAPHVQVGKRRAGTSNYIIAVERNGTARRECTNDRPV